MKKIFKTLSILLVLVLTFSLISCSSFGKVKNALKNAGYELIETDDRAENLEGESQVAVTPYVFSNANNLSVLESYKINVVIVLEFKTTDDMREFYKDSATLQDFISDVKEDGTAEEFYNSLVEKGFANGNCIVISTNPVCLSEICEIIKNA